MSESGDGSRIEAAAAGVHGEQKEAHDSGSATSHVTASDAVPGSAHTAGDAHADDDHGGGHHAADPNAGVVVGLAPTPAWVMTAVAIGVLTLILTIVLGFALRDTPGGTGPAVEEHHATPAAEHVSPSAEGH